MSLLTWTRNPTTLTVPQRTGEGSRRSSVFSRFHQTAIVLPLFPV
jgi:hypothetical protein